MRSVLSFGPPRRREALLGVTLALIALLAYGPALKGGFVWDDEGLIASGGLFTGPLRDIWFTMSLPDYWPLTWTSFWIEWRLWGNSPVGYHAVNVGLHLMAALLLWRVLRAVHVPGAWLGAAIFAVHPATVESVAWISERKNTLSAVFFFAAMLAWTRFQETRRPSARIATIVAFAAALLAKTSTVMLPAVLLGFTWLRKRRLERRDVLEVAPLFGLSLAAGLTTVWYQHGIAIQGLGIERGFGERVGGAGWALAKYLETAFLPVRLAVVYPRWPVDHRSSWFYAPALALVAVLVIVAVVRPARIRPLALAAGYHALMVLPVLGLVDMAYFSVAPISNHLQYLALAGPAAFTGAALSWLRERFFWPALGLSAAVILAMTASTFSRAHAFEANLTLWQHALRETPASSYARIGLSTALRDAGRMPEAVEQLAILARSAIEPDVRHWAAMFVAAHERRFDDAKAHVDALLDLTRHRQRRRDTVSVLFRIGDNDRGIAVLRELVQDAPLDPRLSYDLGAALARSGRIAEAADVLSAFGARRPGVLENEEALAFLLVKLGKMDEALERAAAVERVPTGDPRARARLARWRTQQGW